MRHGHADWAFILNTTLVGVIFIINVFYVIFTIVLRRHADWALYWEVAENPTYDATMGIIVNPSHPGAYWQGIPAWLGGTGYPGLSGPGYVAQAQSKLIGTNAMGMRQRQVNQGTSSPPPKPSTTTMKNKDYVIGDVNTPLNQMRFKPLPTAKNV